MLVKTEGIVIKTIKYSESSIIAQIYTLSHGMLSFIIQGVYSKKAGIKPSFLQPLQLLSMNIYYKENAKLHKINEVTSILKLNNIHFEFSKSVLAMTISELLYKTIKEEEQNESLFTFLKEKILTLDESTAKLTNFFLLFMIHLSKYLGFYPAKQTDPNHIYFDLNEGVFMSSKVPENQYINPPESLKFGSIIEFDKHLENDKFITISERRKLIDHLINYYKVHISNFESLNSYKVLSELLKGK